MSDTKLPQALRENIVLKDGTELDARQTAACFLKASQPDLSYRQIAAQCGYSSETTAWTFLNSRRGQEGCVLAATSLIREYGLLGLQTAKTLATKAKSEKVRLEAALTLMDRAGLTLDHKDARKGAGGDGNVSINISLTDAHAQHSGDTITISSTDSRMKDATPSAAQDQAPGEGGGGKT